MQAVSNAADELWEKINVDSSMMSGRWKIKIDEQFMHTPVSCIKQRQQP
jgi:hypothetical protein